MTVIQQKQYTTINKVIAILIPIVGLISFILFWSKESSMHIDLKGLNSIFFGALVIAFLASLVNLKKSYSSNFGNGGNTGSLVFNIIVVVVVVLCLALTVMLFGRFKSSVLLILLMLLTILVVFIKNIKYHLLLKKKYSTN